MFAPRLRVLGSAAMRLPAIAFLVPFLGACNQPVAGPSAALPVAPAANDPAFAIHELRHWYLTGDGLTPGNDTMTILVDAPSGTDTIDAYVADLPPVRLTVQPTGQHGGQVSLVGLRAGEHDVLLAADGSATAFARLTFQRSAPYYVMVSTDWDFSDPGNPSLDFTDKLHADHPGMKITHFVGPYTFTDPNVSKLRASALAAWVISNRDKYQDEIGLHIHPYCNFVTHAGLACITDQSTVYDSDLSVYTIKVAAYGRDRFATLLTSAKELFAANGLGTPTVFRSGGWTSSLETFQALQDTGFVGDSSALNWRRIEEWKGKELYRWTAEHWAPIDDVSQPYWPSQADILTGAGPTLSVLEVPDNGVMIDYVSLAEMTGIFDANFNGTALAVPTTLMMGFHPSTSFSREEYLRVDGLLLYADKHLAVNDGGPVIYTTLGQMLQVFPN